MASRKRKRPANRTAQRHAGKRQPLADHGKPPKFFQHSSQREGSPGEEAGESSSQEAAEQAAGTD